MAGAVSSMARRRREAGFTYLALVILIAIIGLVGAATLKVDALMRRAAAERELLEIGAAFSDALRSYADATPRGQPPLPPPSLQDLLRDPRYPGVRRHLRKIFVDPITGKAEWGIVYANQGSAIGMGSGAASGTGVLAVYSLSRERPLKVTNFDSRFPNFENKEHLSDWKFAASGNGVSQPAPQDKPGQATAAGPGQGAPNGTLNSAQPPGQTPDPVAQVEKPPSLFPERGVRPATLPANAPAPVSDPAAAPAAPPAPAEPSAQPAEAPPADVPDSKEEDNKDNKDSQDGPDGRRKHEPPPANEEH